MNLKKIITNTTLILLLSGGIASADTHSDVNGHWGSGPINRLVDEKIAGGYPDGTFKPNGTVTVAEFIAFITKSSKANTQEVPVKAGEPWYQGALNTAITSGVVKQDEFSNYNRPITRGEMARMIVRNLGEQPSTGNTIFLDDSKISAATKGYVKKAIEMKIIGGNPDGTFKDSSNATRAEAAAMLVRMIDPNERTAKVTIPAPKPQQPQPNPPAEQKSNFIEPQIEVKYNDNIAEYYYFSINISNIRQYNQDYKFKIEFDNKALNQFENEGFESFGVQVRNDWRPYTDINSNGLITKITMHSNTLVKDKSKFKMYDGAEVKFTIHVKNIKTGVEKKYPGSGIIHKIDFYYHGSPF